MMKSPAVRLVVSLSALLAALPVQAAPANPGQIAAALADPSRPPADRERDAARKAGEVVTLAGVGPGDRVADFIMGGGYLTRILAALVGPSGKVYAYQPAEFISYRAAYGDEQNAVAAAHENVVALRPSLAALSFPEPLDAIVTVQNYHDLHLKVMPAGLADTVNKALFAALKPGGTLLVVDHSAVDGSGFRDADTLHRADRAAVRAEIEKAGFTLEREADLFGNAADARSALVFDPSIRGRTDQFVYLFRKPK